MCMSYKAAEKLLKVVAEHEGMDDPLCTLKVEETNLDSLLAETNSFTLFQMGFIQIDPKKGLTKEGIEYLKQQGWVHPSTIQSRNERKNMEQKFWLMDQKGDGYAWSRPAFAELDLDNVSDDRIQRLANGAEIVQKVSPKSVLPPKAYQRLETVKKARQAAAQKRKESAEQRAAKKKAKEIAEAKKLLQEAGELS